MTREEQSKLISRLANTNISTDDFSYIVTELTESRTCVNCKHFKNTYYDLGRCGKDVFILYRDDDSWYVQEDFGCNKWEVKEK